MTRPQWEFHKLSGSVTRNTVRTKIGGWSPAYERVNGVFLRQVFVPVHRTQIPMLSFLRETCRGTA